MDPSASKSLVRANYFSNQLHNYLSTLQNKKMCYSKVAQSNIKTTKKKDSHSFCSTCLTTSTQQWKLKIKPCKKIPKKLKQKKSISKKFNEVELVCCVCFKKQKHFYEKP